MAVGLNLSKPDIDTMAGVVARDLHAAINRAGQFAYFLAGKTDADLIALGYVQAEVDTLRAAFADLVKIGQVYMGNQIQAAPNDFRSNVRKVFGMGAV